LPNGSAGAAVVAAGAAVVAAGAAVVAAGAAVVAAGAAVVAVGAAVVAGATVVAGAAVLLLPQPAATRAAVMSNATPRRREFENDMRSPFRLALQNVVSRAQPFPRSDTSVNLALVVP
jgi:formylmethanofuran dehydrogenase subunit C